jgi:hypothetical protein
MTIDTKYQIGDIHWDIDMKQAKALRVHEIRITIRNLGDAPPAIDITYVVSGSLLVPENNFIPTKEALLQSL